MPCIEWAETKSICYNWEKEAYISLKHISKQIVVCPHWKHLNSTWVSWRLTMNSTGLDAGRTQKASEIPPPPLFFFATVQYIRHFLVLCLIFTFVLQYHKWENWGCQRSRQNKTPGLGSLQAPFLFTDSFALILLFLSFPFPSFPLSLFLSSSLHF